MAIVIKYNPREFIKEIDKYEKKRMRFVSYRTVHFLGKKVVEDVNKKYKEKGFFKDPVPLTLNSTFAKTYTSKAEVDIFPKDDKSLFTNAPRNYLYPVIGGGSPKAYETRFVQWLKANNYMNQNQYPFANKSNPLIKTIGSNKRVLPAVYADIQRALRATDSRSIKYNAQGDQIQSQRVFAMKTRFPKKAKRKQNRYRPGIYRVSLQGGSKSKTFIQPLFTYGRKPSVKPKDVTFFDLVKKSSDKNIRRIFIREFEKNEARFNN
tara:strand:+ start:373 stop:1164 length:792 start_codon:yes stop_codon:yes gene_type:complete